MKKYNMSFEFIKDEKDAKEFCERENKSGSYYKRSHHMAHYLPYKCKDGSFDGFICFYWYQ